MAEKSNKNEFSRDFLIALSNWQRGWYEKQDVRRVLADELEMQCRSLPLKFKTVNRYCYRKRFIIDGEMIPIVYENFFFEGIASWSLDKTFAKGFKKLIRQGASFVMLFKHKPVASEIILNINSLWLDNGFKDAVFELSKEDSIAAEPLMHFKTSQSEVILRSTLKGSEIEDIAGISSSFEDLCNRAEIPLDKQEELSKHIAKNPEELPIEILMFVGNRPTKKAITKVLSDFKQKIIEAKKNNTIVDWSKAAQPHIDDLKHM